MKKWADYLISEVSYDSEHLISIATRHQDTDSGITKGKSVDRLTIASDIKNGFTYITIYSGNNSWKPGNKLRTFSIGGNPYLRIDKNKAKLDYLGDLPESSFAETIQELESQPEPITEPEPPSSPRGSLPKESTEELPQELELVPEPITKPEEEEATPEQLSQVNDLQQQIDDLENVLSNQKLSKYEPEEEEATPEQLSKVKELEKEIEKLEAVDIEHEIIQTLRKQNKKLDDIENKINNSVNVEIKTPESPSQEAYCVKCKTKRIIKNPEETIMKNGRPAIKGICSICECKVFRITKMKK
jgi:uncharacterized phage infection (PIP) family protein YhgE